MGKRDILFWGLVAGFVLLAGAALRLPGPPVAAKLASHGRDPKFHQTVRRIDRALAPGQAEASDGSSEPIPRASDLAIARRLALALVGTIPSLEEIRAFEGQPAAGRIDWWTRVLLADRRADDYLAERLARSLVGVEEGPFLLYRRRRFVSWLAGQLHKNRPYDEIVRELVASTGLWTDRPATNFITVSFLEETERADENKLAVRVCRAMLGLRLDCAQCHDHPFDARWQQEDFQGLAAFFGGIESSLTGVHDAPKPYRLEDRQTGQLRTIEVAVPFQPELLPQQGARRQRLARWITHSKNRAFARATVNRFWTLMVGRPLVEPVDDIPLDENNPAALDILATDFVRHHYNLRWLIQTIGATAAFQAESRAPPRTSELASPTHEPSSPASSLAAPAIDLAPWQMFPLTRLRPEQVVGALIQSASLATIHHQSHILVRLARTLQQNEFVNRYGDLGGRELEASSGTIPQRLMLLNGHLLHEKTKDDLVSNAATRIAALAPSDTKAIEVAYLTVLTRRPTPGELAHFSSRLAGQNDVARRERIEDLTWALLNSTEFSWNH